MLPPVFHWLSKLIKQFTCRGRVSCRIPGNGLHFFLKKMTQLAMRKSDPREALGSPGCSLLCSTIEVVPCLLPSFCPPAEWWSLSFPGPFLSWSCPWWLCSLCWHCWEPGPCVPMATTTSGKARCSFEHSKTAAIYQQSPASFPTQGVNSIPHSSLPSSIPSEPQSFGQGEREASSLSDPWSLIITFWTLDKLWQRKNLFIWFHK